MKYLTIQARLVHISPFIFILTLGNPAWGQYTYTTLDDPLGVMGTQPMGISGGNMVGEYSDAGGKEHGFLYNGSGFTTLDDPLATSGGTFATGISGGNIVGTYFNVSGNHGFLFNGITYKTIDEPLASHGTVVTGIDGGNIVGYYSDAAFHEHGFLYNGSTYTTLDDPLAFSTQNLGTAAYGISGSNIVGTYTDANNVAHGFLYDGTTYITLTEPNAATNSPGPPAFGTFAVGISGNNIVGYYVYSSGQGEAGFLYNGTTYEDIVDPDGVGTLTRATGISDNTIVGYYNGAHVVHGFLANPVPEPGEWALLGFGIAALLGSARRHF